MERTVLPDTYKTDMVPRVALHERRSDLPIEERHGGMEAGPRPHKAL